MIDTKKRALAESLIRAAAPTTARRTGQTTACIMAMVYAVISGHSVRYWYNHENTRRDTFNKCVTILRTLGFTAEPRSEGLSYIAVKETGGVIVFAPVRASRDIRGIGSATNNRCDYAITDGDTL